MCNHNMKNCQVEKGNSSQMIDSLSDVIQIIRLSQIHSDKKKRLAAGQDPDTPNIP